MKKGQEYTGSVERVRFPNKAVVSVLEEPGEKCIVKNALPGQKIRFRVSKKRGGSCEGTLLEVIERSPAEVESACPHFDKCGGCSYQTLPYDEQLKIKEEQVHALLEPVLRHGMGGDEIDEVDIKSLFEPILSSPKQFEYRNKMEFSFGDASFGGNLELGLHKRGSFYDIVTVKDCRIVDDDFKKILSETLAYFRGKETPYYHKRTHEGFLRFLLVRKAAKTGEILVDLVTTSQTPADTICTEVSPLDDWKETLLALKLSGKLVGILHTVDDRLADIIADDHTEVLYGCDFFFEEVLGLRFKITPFSFFQTNTLSAEVLYSKVREYAELACGGENEAGKDRTSPKVIYDLYSGTGTIGQIMSTEAEKVIGVEIVEEAVKAANENAAANGLHNCEFICGDVLKVLDGIKDRPDLIILDPPRDGINPKALSKIVGYGVDNIIYISCKPTSLARDLEFLMANGYHPVKICPIDQFAGTFHVETVALLSKLSEAKHFVNIKVEMDEMDLTCAESKATYRE
ncbi:MAG: 23S rRNA (uracil(1939)-C(5))-methyltransferase RlmD, partial [Lachnospiraceae bacterium]|nr:23S rRNA (uracil(1939)-C(5))-methyltransferase RlmD [Lachnospiraceae bacterium]